MAEAKSVIDQQPVTKEARSRGRPRAANNIEQTTGRAALIDATIELLKTVGPAHITASVVARSVNVHPSLIRYYFRNRATLLVGVADKIVQEFSSRFEMYATDGGTPSSRLAGRIRTMIDLNAIYPFFHQLFVTEILHSRDPAAVAIVAELAERGVQAYGSILRAGAGDGSLREADPQLVYTAVVGMSEFFVSAYRQFVKAGMGPIEEHLLREQYKDFACDLILNGLKATPSLS